MNSLFDHKAFIKRIILLSVVIGGIFALFIPVGVVSQTNDPTSTQSDNVCATFGGDESCVGGIDRFNTEGSSGVVTLVLNIATILTFISGAVAVLFIVYGGFQAITAAGDQNKYSSGLKTVQYAIVGLILAIVAYTIVAVVGGFVGNLDIS